MKEISFVEAKHEYNSRSFLMFLIVEYMDVTIAL